MKKIVFISRLDNESQSQWLSCLREQLIEETILLPEQINEADLHTVDIAIVADPDPSVIDKFPNLIWIQSLWSGVEKLVSEKSLQHIKIVRLVDPQLAKTMAEAVIAWTLYLHRNMPEYAQQQIKKQWQQLPYIPARNIKVGVLGAGNLGLASLKSLQQLEYQVSCWSRTPKQLEGIKSYSGNSGLESIMSNSDIVISLLPLTAETHHLLNTTLLTRLPVGAKIINFSRGAIIDTQAMLKLLATRHISHAVLDVFEHEPLPFINPIWNNPNITVLPHISAPTDMNTSIEIAAANIQKYRELMIIPNTVNAQLGY
jgi:glyoxylate/hydroxypyruvate reductase A